MAQHVLAQDALARRRERGKRGGRLWVPLALVTVGLGAAVRWFLMAEPGGGRRRAADSGARVQDAPAAPPAAHADALDDADDDADDVADASAFGGTPTPPSDVVGPAESWIRDAQDEDALLATDEGHVAPEAEDPRPDSRDVPPVRSATRAGDVAGVGEPETVAAVEAQSEATAPTPDAASVEDLPSRD